MTAGNSPSRNDGASAVVPASAPAGAELAVEPLARVVASATAVVDPRYMGIVPPFAIPKALARGGLWPQQGDVWEIHKAFASVAFAVLRERRVRYGVAGVCLGSRQGVALVLENPRAA